MNENDALPRDAVVWSDGDCAAILRALGRTRGLTAEQALRLAQEDTGVRVCAIAALDAALRAFGQAAGEVDPRMAE